MGDEIPSHIHFHANQVTLTGVSSIFYLFIYNNNNNYYYVFFLH